MKEPETSNEYDRFKALLGKVLAVPHSEIKKREEEYQKQVANSPKRGPKPRVSSSRVPGADSPT